MPYRRTPQIQARMQAQRSAILAAAGQLLADAGYRACSVSAVAQQAGVAAGTVYNHFASKADLAAELFRTAADREVNAVRDAAAQRPAAVDKLTAVVEVFAGRALKEPRRAYALLAEPVDPAVDALRLEFRHAFREVVADAVSTGVRTGELPRQNTDVVAAALVGAIGEALVGPLAAARTGDGEHAPDTIPTVIRFVHRAVGSNVDEGAADAHT
jgi:AcrR family transcriptional regulator